MPGAAPTKLIRSTGWRRWSLTRSAWVRSGLATIVAIWSRDTAVTAGVVTVDVAVDVLVVVTGTISGGLSDAQPSRAAANRAAGTARSRGFGCMACLVV